MYVALNVLWSVVKGSVMTDCTCGSHNNDVHDGGTDVSAVGNKVYVYLNAFILLTLE